MIDALLSLSFNVHAHKGTYALLLGSGISRSAGIPTGWELTLEMIGKLANLQQQDCRADPAGWYAQTFGKEPDYAELLAAIAPTSAAQQQLLKYAFEPTDQEREDGRKMPTAAHAAIARLVRLGYIRVIVTTNFDRLLEIALQAEGIAPVVIASPDAAKGAPPFVHTPCAIIKVHGDYLDHRLKNSPDALARYDKAIDRLLDQVFEDYGLIVCGWSADYDTALRAAIERCKARRYPTYWTALSKPADTAQTLINLRTAQVITVTGADQFFASLLEKVEAMEEYNRPHPITVQSAVVTLKRYLAEDKYRIALHDLFVREADACNATCAGAFDRVQQKTPSKETAPELMRRLEASTEILMHMFATASFHAAPAQAKPVFDAFHRLAARAEAPGGYNVWISLRRYPALLALYAAGLAGMAAENFAVLTVIASRPSIPSRSREEDLSASLRLNAHDVLERDHARAVLPGAERNHTPFNDHLFNVLKPVVAPFVASEAKYQRLFDSFGYFWCLIHVDAQIHTKTRVEPWTPYGSFIWRQRDSENWFRHEVGKAVAEVNRQWFPLTQGLFGGSIERLITAYNYSQPNLASIADRMW
jgi:hypothetical protein